MADDSNNKEPIEGEAVRLHELRIVSFLNDQGDEVVDWHWVDDNPPAISQAVGLLEMTKLLMIDETGAQDR